MTRAAPFQATVPADPESAGVPAALTAGRLVTSQLFHVTPHDPLAIAVASLTMATVALVAAWLPARRAARANPLVALREG